MHFTHDIADQLEAQFPVRVTQWGTQAAPAVAVNKEVPEDQESDIIHKAASWLREQGFVDIRFDTGHDDAEGQPVIVIRHPWDENGAEQDDGQIDVDQVVALVQEGKIAEALQKLPTKSPKKNAQVEIPLEDLDDKLEEAMDDVSSALSHLDELVFSLGAHDANKELDEATSDLAHTLTEKVDDLSTLALEVKGLIDRIDENLP